jgi:hypothetical protein
MISISPVATYFFKQTAPIAPPAETAGAAGEETTHFSSVGEAVRSALADSDPRVIVFGEIHPMYGSRVGLPKAYFADEVLPVLRDEGILDVTVEQIRNDPAIERELDYFYETGRFGSISTPTLWQTVNIFSDWRELVHMLFRARALGIRIHPGGITMAQAEETIERDDCYTNVELGHKIWRYFEEAGRGAADRMLATGRRFAMYNGMMHHEFVANRVSEEMPESDTNYGEYLAQTLGDEYAEFEFLPRGSLGTLLLNDSLDFYGVSNWLELMPETGVNLVERGAHSHLLFIG